MKNIVYKTGGVELLDSLGPLWIKLNEHHRNVSENFSNAHSSFTFSQRKHIILNKKDSTYKIHLAFDHEKIIGYCISSISDSSIGEIESLYIEPDYRGNSIGDNFMTSSLSWMDENGTKKKILGVSVGNHKALKFYERYGFKARTTIMQQI